MEGDIIHGSSASIRSNLDLGSVYPTDISTLQSSFQPIYPTSNLADSLAPIVFCIPSSTTHYNDFTESFLFTTTRIWGDGGTKLSSTDIVAPNHDFASALFSGIEIDMNGTIVTKSATLLPYRSHILKLLTTGADYKIYAGPSELWIPDSIQDNFSVSDNLGFAKRLAFSAESKQFEMIFKLSASIAEQHRYFPPEISTTITLRKSPPEFCLDAADPKKTYSLEVTKCILYLKRHTVSSSVLSLHQKLLSGGGKLQYPMKSFELRAFNIGTGTQTVLSEVLFRAKLPEFIATTFVSTSALQGSFTKSPFNFQTFNVAEISAKINGDSQIYSKLAFDFDNNEYLIGFNTLLSAVASEEPAGISRSDYAKGQFFVCHDINPTSGNGFVKEQYGTVQVDIKFKSPLAESVTCLVMGQFQSILQIDSNKTVTVD